MNSEGVVTRLPLPVSSWGREAVYNTRILKEFILNGGCDEDIKFWFPEP